jgi:hypothetical protein
MTENIKKLPAEAFSALDDKLDNKTDKSSELIKDAAKQFAGISAAKDRTAIVKYTMLLYCLAVGLSILYLFVKGICCGQDNSNDISEIIKTAVLPIVTLVIGYYFGSDKNT